MANNENDRVAVWGGEPKPLMPYSPAISAGGWVFVAGQLASDFVTGLAAEAGGDGRNPNSYNHLEIQSRFVLQNLQETLAAAGCDIGTDIVRIYQWFTSPHPTIEEFSNGNAWPQISITPYLRTRNEFVHEPRPASTGMGIRDTGLLVNKTILEVDLIAIPGGGSEGFESPADVPSPLAGYSPAIRRGDWIFCAGEIPVDWMGDFMQGNNMGTPSGIAPEARVNPYFWYGSEIESQTNYVLQKLEKIVQSAGGSIQNTVKATVYLASPNDFEGMERVWKEWFPTDPPARVVVPYMGLGGKGSRIEIALKVLSDDASISKETIETPNAVHTPWHEPQAVKAGDFLFLSTAIACDEKGNLPESVQRHPEFPWYGQPPKLQMAHILDNTAAICEAAGTSIENIVRRQCFHDDFTHFQQSIEQWSEYFPGDKPASTTLEIGGPLQVPGAHFLMDLIAYVPPG
jgi:enamine deaminase RidA (YjgF/YER057c/UK114 family)